MQSDPYLDARAALRAGDPAPALSLLAATRDDPEARLHAVATLGNVSAPALGREPESPEQWLLAGILHTRAGWDARGADYVERTSGDQIDGLLHHMGRARKALRRAAELLPADPAPWYLLMSCAGAASESPGEPHAMWKELAARGGDMAYHANTMRLTILTGRWHGSTEESFAFARERTRDLPPGHPLHALIPLVHVEEYIETGGSGNPLTRVWRMMRYFKRREVRQEIDAAADRLIAGADAFAGHPASPHANQAFAFVYDDLGDLDRSRLHLQRGGTEPAGPWGYHGDDEYEVFDTARRHAGLPRLPRP